PGDHNGRYLLIATGTGVTPYRSMLPLLRRAIAERGVEVVLLQGARTPQELLYSEDFRAFAEATPGFRYMPCLSRELPADPHPDVRKGYVQQQLAEIGPDPTRDITYLCGNPDMVDACAELLKAAGLPPPQIRREKYVSSK
ncbi:MAG: ferredoxin--NADP reductase, partial [Stenotrophomonas sp.]